MPIRTELCDGTVLIDRNRTVVIILPARAQREHLFLGVVKPGKLQRNALGRNLDICFLIGKVSGYDIHWVVGIKIPPMLA